MMASEIIDNRGDDAYKALWKLIEEGGDAVTNKTELSSLIFMLKYCSVQWPACGVSEGKSTLLLHAAKYGRRFVFRMLLEAGADPTVRSVPSNVNVLHYITERGNEKECISCGGSVRDAELCLLAIEKKRGGRNVDQCKKYFMNEKDADGFTPLMNIVRYRGDVKLALLLENHGAATNNGKV